MTNATVQSDYKSKGQGFYYQSASFGVQWGLGDNYSYLIMQFPPVLLRRISCCQAHA